VVLQAGYAIGLGTGGLFCGSFAAGDIPRVILSMLLILVGVQIGLFGFLADMYRK